MIYLVSVPTRHREHIEGAIPFYCPACGRRIIANTVTLHRARSLFGSSRDRSDVATYLRCRLCGLRWERPSGSKLGTFFPPDAVIPDEDEISRQIPSGAGQTPKDENDAGVSELPSGVTRLQWALMNGITQELERSGRNVSDSTTMGIALLIGFGALFGIFFVLIRYQNRPLVLPFVTLGLIVSILAFLAFKLNRCLTLRSVHKSISPHIARHAEFTGTTGAELLNVCRKLGNEFAGADAYLQWAAERR